MLEPSSGLLHRVRGLPSAVARPTVVLLHGRGGDELVMRVFERTLPEGWGSVAPRAPHAHAEGGFAWHPRKPGQWPSLDQFGPAVELVLRFIHALPGLYGVDLQQLYVMGFSQGAALAYALALTRPGIFQGVAGLVGFLPTGELPGGRPLADLPVFAAVGRQDPLIPLEVAQEGLAGLQQVGARIEAHEYETGHKLDAQGMRDLTAWWAVREAGLHG